MPLFTALNWFEFLEDMQPSVVGWQPLVKSWLTKLPVYITPQLRDNLFNLFVRYVQPGLDVLRAQCNPLIELVDSNIVTSLCDLFLAILLDNNELLQNYPVCYLPINNVLTILSTVSRRRACLQFVVCV